MVGKIIGGLSICSFLEIIYDARIKAYYAGDGIDPNGAGNGALQAGFQQSLSISTI